MQSQITSMCHGNGKCSNIAKKKFSSLGQIHQNNSMKYANLSIIDLELVKKHYHITINGDSH